MGWVQAKLASLDQELLVLRRHEDAMRIQFAELKAHYTQVRRDFRYLQKRQWLLARKLDRAVGGAERLKCQIQLGNTILGTQVDIRNIERFIQRRKNRIKIARWRRTMRERKEALSAREVQSLQPPRTPSN